MSKLASTAYKRTLAVAAMPAKQVNGFVPVHWRLDAADRQGVVHVALPDDIEDPAAAAELVALHYLMTCPRPVFGSTRAPSSALTTVTVGAIKKALRKDTDKLELIPFARFLFFSFSGSTLEVSKETAWVHSLPVVEEIRITAAHNDGEQVMVTCLGNPVVVTRHAAERYQERMGTQNLAATLVGLRRILSDPATATLSITEARRFSTLARYGKEATLLWHPPSRAVFVILPERGGLVLATVYVEPPPTKQAVYAGGRIEMRNC